MCKRFAVFRSATLIASLMLPVMASVPWDATLMAQAPVAPAARQLGTVTAISGDGLTLKTDAGQQVTITVANGARILQLAPGSTDLKTAQAIELKDIAVGDRILASGKAGDNSRTSAVLPPRRRCAARNGPCCCGIRG